MMAPVVSKDMLHDEVQANGKHEDEQPRETRNGMEQHPSDGNNGEKVKKHVVLSEHDHAAIAVREMEDAETALEVDHMILDFFLFQAIKACLNSRRPASTAEGGLDADVCLSQADQFLHLFNSRYTSYRPDKELHFRQLLLQLVVLFTRRFDRSLSTPPKASLQALRVRNKARARTWIGNASRLPTVNHNVQPFDNALPISIEELEENRARVLRESEIPAEDDAYDDAFYGTSDCVSLLDILPLFMRASATCHSMFRCPPTEKWMQLAAGWMLQACLEQYLAFGSSGSDAIDEAFAWGPRQQLEDRDGKDEEMADDTLQEDISEDPFGPGMDQEDVDLWNTLKTRALETILSAEKQCWKDIASHLAAVWGQYPLVTTEKDIKSFLEDLASCIPEPVLEQLQKGKLQGMTRAETTSFIDECGVDLAKVFASVDVLE